jgi:hypothetical protein
LLEKTCVNRFKICWHGSEIPNIFPNRSEKQKLAKSLKNLLLQNRKCRAAGKKVLKSINGSFLSLFKATYCD